MSATQSSNAVVPAAPRSPAQTQPRMTIDDLIREAKTHQIGSLLQTGQKVGMQTLDSHLAQLVRNRTVTYEDALARAQNIIEFNTLVGDANPNIQRDAKGRPLCVSAVRKGLVCEG